MASRARRESSSNRASPSLRYSSIFVRCSRYAFGRLSLKELIDHRIQRDTAPDKIVTAVPLLDEILCHCLNYKCLHYDNDTVFSKDAFRSRGRSTRFHHMITPVTAIAAGAKPNSAHVAFVA